MNYTMISPQQAKEMIDSLVEYHILDVRTEPEYEVGHIPNAILLPYDEVASRAQIVITDLDSTILVYCRSGQRSKIAATVLASLGYTNVYEFGGILDWPYDVTKIV